MQNNISPEERLLRLIKGKPQQAKPLKKEEVSPQSPLLRHFLRHFSFSRLNHTYINRVFLVILLILGIYLLTDSFINSPYKIEKEVLSLRELKSPPLEVPLVNPTSAKPLSYYNQSVESRNLFATVEPQSQKTTASFMEMVSKFKLQGIISGSNPQAIIEDTKTRQVYFVAPGENIGEIELKGILPGKVKLTYYGQEAELPL